MSKQSFRSPKGNLAWAYITGQGRKNLNGKDEFTIQVQVPAADAAGAIAEINAFWEANKPKGAKAAKSLGYKISADESEVIFTLKTSTTYADGKAKEIRIFNSKAEPVTLPANTRVGNGSRGRASGIMAIYDGGVAARGVTLYLDAVQLTKFVPYAGNDPGFEAEDDGEFSGFSDSPSEFTADSWL